MCDGREGRGVGRGVPRGRFPILERHWRPPPGRCCAGRQVAPPPTSWRTGGRGSSRGTSGGTPRRRPTARRGRAWCPPSGPGPAAARWRRSPPPSVRTCGTTGPTCLRCAECQSSPLRRPLQPGVQLTLRLHRSDKVQRACEPGAGASLASVPPGCAAPCRAPRRDSLTSCSLKNLASSSPYVTSASSYHSRIPSVCPSLN